MIVCIAGLLDGAALGKVRSLLDEARFSDGARTAGWHARQVKANRQAEGNDPAARQAGALVAKALLDHPVFRSAVQPLRLRPPLFARYGPGESYGAHVDDAVMGAAGAERPLRTDVAATVFLAAADAYDGGELVVEDAAGEQSFKLAAGDAVAYPATTLHRVAPVLSGERLVAVTWAQSLVRDPAKREILFDLDNARRSVFAQSGKSAAFDLVAKAHANLLRQWAET